MTASKRKIISVEPTHTVSPWRHAPRSHEHGNWHNIAVTLIDPGR